MKRTTLLFCIVTLITSCENNTTIEDSTQIEKYITASVGGELVLSDSIILKIPAGSLPTDGEVFLGITGSETFTTSNSNLEIIGSPVTIRIPSESLLKPITLEFSKPANLDTIRTCIWGFNGSTYFPFNYSIGDDKLIVTIDIIDWKPNSLKSLAIPIVSEFIIYKTYSKQYPSFEQLGLKRVSINDEGQLSFQPPTVKPASKVLLLVHGWTGDASTWDGFLSRVSANSSLDYSEIWTFVYISALSITHNATILKEGLAKYANEKQVDIVAHSMGGLVARSMIEQCDGSGYVNKIITLGTPHEGSPLAVFRYLLAALVDVKDIIHYNINTQGFRDLNVGSKFIVTLNQSRIQEVPYFTIASLNNPEDPSNSIIEKFLSQQASQLLTGDDDGIVQVSSALSIKGATSPEAPIQINTAWAHIAMPDNDRVFQQVVEYLQEEPQDPGSGIIYNPDLIYGNVNDIDGNIYRTIQIGTQIWMAENLKTTKYKDGTPIPKVTSQSTWGSLTTGAYCDYNDDSNYGQVYGHLYNFHAVTNSKGVCPTGWHVPTDNEWKTLEMYLGMSAQQANLEYTERGTNEGGRLKEMGTVHWLSPNTGATNSSGFTALPGMYLNQHGVHATPAHHGGFWWTSTNGYYRGLHYNNSTIWRWYYPYTAGFSIRCIKD